MSNQPPIPKKLTMMDYGIRKLGLFVSVIVGLFVVYIITATIPALTAFEGMIVYGSVLGATVFVFYFHFGVEVKKWKKLRD